MKVALLVLALFAVPALAEPVAVPSGQPVEFLEIVRDTKGTMGLTWRFRFVAPDISRGKDKIPFEDVTSDMDFLCNQYAVPRLPTMGPKPKQVIISLADEASEFGVASPEITQFFEAYSIQDNACIWEGF